jgi:hypothetical protein
MLHNVVEMSLLAAYPAVSWCSACAGVLLQVDEWEELRQNGLWFGKY